MIYEFRTYRLQPGTIAEYIRLVGDDGIAIQARYLGALIGYFTSDIGPLNEVVHIWAYQDLNDRGLRRANLDADPQWRRFIPKIQRLIVAMETKIMQPTNFSPLT